MAAPAYDPTLYSSTGSWAGMPYDQQLSYGGAPAYPQQPAAPFPGSYGPGPGGPGWAPSGPPRMVSMQYEGAPPHDPYRGSLPPGFNDPYGYPGPYGPPPPRPPKVFGVGILFAEQMGQMGLEVVVKDVYMGSPGVNQVQQGDVLKAVDGQDVTGLTIRELRGFVPGPLGSKAAFAFEGWQGQGVYEVELERVQSNRGAPTVYGDSRGPPAQRQQEPQPPVNNEGKAYVGFSVQVVGDPRYGPDFVVANVTAESTADQKGLVQGDKVLQIDGTDIRGMHEQDVKQMLVGEPFSEVAIQTSDKTVQIERDCAVPEPEAGGPGGGRTLQSGPPPIQSGARPVSPARDPYGYLPYGDAGYAPPPLAQPSDPYGYPPYGANPFGAPSYRAPPYGAPPYGAPPYGAPPYGALPYGASPYGVPAYGPPPGYGRAMPRPRGYGYAPPPAGYGYR